MEEKSVSFHMFTLGKSRLKDDSIIVYKKLT